MMNFVTYMLGVVLGSLNLKDLRPKAKKPHRSSGKMLMFEAMEDRTPLAVYTVVTAADTETGPMSLRQAIILANKKPDTDTIKFQIGTGLKTIYPSAPLPKITSPVILDGTSQPGYSGTPIIEVNGSKVTVGRGQPAASGLVIATSNSIVRGFVIDQWAGFGVALATNGTTPNNRIGNNVVQKNYIGIDPSGAIGRGNKQGGVQVVNSWNNSIEGNVISANGTSLIVGAGISIAENYGGSQGTVIKGNLIGTDVTGKRSLGNTSHGISAVNVAATTIGGTEPGARNVISGNGGSGISLDRSNATVQGNFIGTLTDGTSPAGNGDQGVIVSGASNCMIGGTAPGAGNTIANNRHGGVAVLSGTGNAILGNAIHSNLPLVNILPNPNPFLAIDLGPDGPTANDPNDPDIGANNLQNFPVLESASIGLGGSAILGTINSNPNTQLRLEFFKNTSRDAFTGRGGSQTFLGFMLVVTNETGIASFIFKPTDKLAVGQVITATATDTKNNTSEFSKAVVTKYDTTSPTADIIDVTPDPRATPIAQARVIFSEAIVGLRLSNLRLTRDGGPNLLTARQTVTTSDNKSWTIGNLSSLTADAGRYTLSVISKGSGITDVVGNPITGDASDQWDELDGRLLPNAEFQVNTATVGDQLVVANAVAAAPNGSFVVVWTGPGRNGQGIGIYVRRYDGQGVASDEERVDSTQNPAFEPAVAVGADGSYVVVWQGPDSSIRAHIFEASGASRGSEILVSPGISRFSKMGPKVAIDAKNNFVVTWSSDVEGFPTVFGNWGVYARRFNASGAPLAAEFHVNETTVNSQRFSTVAMDANGGMIIAWANEGTNTYPEFTQYDIFARRFDASGQPKGGEFRVNSTIKFNQNEPTIAAAPDGQFVVAWTNLNTDGSGTDLYAQRYDSQGTKIGSEFRLNTTTASNQSQPSLAMNASGEFVATWTSNEQDGSGLGVFAQSYYADGSPKGTEKRVNDFSAGDQRTPSVAMFADGRFVVIWTSQLQDGSGWGVFGQRFGPSRGAPIADVLNVTPDPRLTSISSVGLEFSRPIIGLDVSDLRLTRDGGPNLLSVDNMLTTVDRISWTLGNLAALTAAPGEYTLTLVADGSGIKDATGASLQVGASDKWTVVPPKVSISPVFPGQAMGEAAGFAVFTVTLSGAVDTQVSVEYESIQAGGLQDATSRVDYEYTKGTLYFASGVTSATLSVPIINDTTIETEEYFAVRLTNPHGADLSTATVGVCRILDDDVPDIAITDARVTEGDNGTSIVEVVVNFTKRSPVPVGFDLATADGTAVHLSQGTQRQDYSATSYRASDGTGLTFYPGPDGLTNLSYIVTLYIIGDRDVEPNEYFWVNLSNPKNGRLVRSQASVTILNDDQSPPSIVIADTQVEEGNDGAHNVKVPVFLTQPAAETVFVNYRAYGKGEEPGQTATYGEDYYFPSGIVTIPKGRKDGYAEFTIQGDKLPEGDETFLVRLFNAQGAAITLGDALVTILDDDSPLSRPSFSIEAGQPVIEGNSGIRNATFSVRLSSPSDRETRISFATVDGSAKAGSDYDAVRDNLTFAKYETGPKTITVPVRGNMKPEPNRNFSVVLSQPTGGATIADGQGSAAMTILDDDSGSILPALSIEAGPPVLEGDSGTRNATFTVHLTSPSSSRVTVKYATLPVPGTASLDVDYISVSETLTFEAGDTTPKTITITIQGDIEAETDETFFVTLSTPTGGAVIADGQGEAVGTILDDDPGAIAPPELSIEVGPPVVEGNSGTRNATFTVRLSSPSRQQISVSYGTSDDFAKAGEDYGAAIGTVTFAAGVTAPKTITIPIYGDTLPEPDERFFVSLNTPFNAVIKSGAGQATGTILDDDRRPDVAVNSARRLTSTDGAFNNFQGFDITYTVSGAAPPPFRIGIYVSADNRFDPGTDKLLRPNAFSAIEEQNRQPNPDGSMKNYTRRIDLGATVNTGDTNEVTHEIQGFGSLAKSFYILAVAEADVGGPLSDADSSNNVRAATLTAKDPLSPSNSLTHAQPDDPASRLPGRTLPERGTSFLPANTLNFSAGRTAPVQQIVLHAMAGTMAGSIGRFQEGTLVSAHYLIAQDGNAVQMVPEQDTAFHASPSNSTTIGIELEDRGHHDTDESWVTPALMNSTVDLARSILSDPRYSIGLKHPSGQVGPGAGGIIAHGQVIGHTAGKTDPKTWPWPEFMQRLSGYANTLVPNVGLPNQAYTIDWGPKTGMTLDFLASGINIRSAGTVIGQRDEIWSASSATDVFMPVHVRLGAEDRLIGYVTGSLSMSLFRPGSVEPTGDKIFLNGPPDITSHVVRWTTPGLVLTDPAGRPRAGATTGPLTYWAVAEQLTRDGVSLGQLDQALFPEVVRAMAELAQRSAINRLVSTIRLVGINDPGKTSMLVTAPDGSQTGALPSGQVVAEIPNSYYFADAPAVLLVNPPAIGFGFGYVTEVTAQTAGDFLLLAGSATFPAGADHATVEVHAESGSLALGETAEFVASVDSGAVDLSGLLTVTTTDDFGPGSLRQAIVEANARPGRQTIRFVLPGSGVHTIKPASPLPTITDPVVIDGTSQAGYAGRPVVVLDGINAGAADGLRIAGGGSVLKALVIDGFVRAAGMAGVHLIGAGGNFIEGCYIGVDSTGSVAAANYYGILVEGSPGNTIGGQSAGKGNLISGNLSRGIFIFGSGASGNLVEGNLIGTDLNGDVALGNGSADVTISNASGNSIGGPTLGARNVISGLSPNGVVLSGGSSGNKIQGNYIGTDRSGSSALGGHFVGVYVSYSPGNIIGGVGAGNLISGNGTGIELDGDTTQGNLIQGNRIGTDATGSRAIGNGIGVEVSSAFANTIGGTAPNAGNLISGNTSVGVKLRMGSANNSVLGNLIGTDVTGRVLLATDPTNWGVRIEDSPRNTIGGTAPGARNVISGNGREVEITGGGATGNVVQGNFIGTDLTGSFAIHVPVPGVSFVGITISNASGNTVGGASQEARNIISEGDSGQGLWIISFPGLPAATSNLVQGNFIGTDITGTRRIGNAIGVQVSASGNTIGGSTAGAGNMISGSVTDGMKLDGSGNVVQGNFIGTDAAGMAAIPNGNNGIDINSAWNIIGGTTPGAGNLISGNQSSGIQVFGGSAGLLVQGNFIGTDVTGTRPLGNGSNGVSLYTTSGNTIGGIDPVAGNVIAFNAGAGVAVVAQFDNALGTGNAILSNVIFGNASLGIDLGAAPGQSPGVTSNDEVDLDFGANGLQNFPVLTEATSSAVSTVRGFLNSTPNRTFRVQLFVSAAANASGFGEGQTFLAAIVVTTDTDGNATFTINFPIAIPAGSYITATATDSDNNTSEFSKALLVTVA